MNSKELLNQSEKIKALKLAREEMACVTATDRIKTALARNVLSAVDEDLVEGREGHMCREKDRRMRRTIFLQARRENVDP